MITQPKIVDFKAKWEEESFEYENTIREFPGEKLNPVLSEKINGDCFEMLACFWTERICKG